MLGAIGILLDIELSRNDVKTPANQIPGPWYPHSEDTSDLLHWLQIRRGRPQSDRAAFL